MIENKHQEMETTSGKTEKAVVEENGDTEEVLNFDILLKIFGLGNRHITRLFGKILHCVFVVVTWILQTELSVSESQNSSRKFRCHQDCVFHSKNSDLHKFTSMEISCYL